MYDCDHSLFLALNFDGRPPLRQGSCSAVSGTAMWIPFYLLILWLVWRRYGWRNMLLFILTLAVGLVLSDMICGIFKHSGPLEKPLGGSFPALASHVHPGTRTPRNPG